ncbi:hypothetical protein HaLaN_12685 [Haematococcus lacustris]|uniref:Uncharacterized protein n=1 Tax=Haematococcus lacustris TaxID=44745 RepID=A0A699Z408_HAELA|nr:hypothetical protein HaLaN_12685 [Haematococcus lacustris]
MSHIAAHSAACSSACHALGRMEHHTTCTYPSVCLYPISPSGRLYVLAIRHIHPVVMPYNPAICLYVSAIWRCKTPAGQEAAVEASFAWQPDCQRAFPTRTLQFPAFSSKQGVASESEAVRRLRALALQHRSKPTKQHDCLLCVSVCCPRRRDGGSAPGAARPPLEQHDTGQGHIYML